MGSRGRGSTGKAHASCGLPPVKRGAGKAWLAIGFRLAHTCEGQV